jgi:RNA polymerase sigma-70 factor (ECF subfamily)
VEPSDRADLEHAEDLAAVRAIRAGQIDAFAGIVQRHAPTLRRLLRRFLRGSDDVDDALQESLLRAYRALDRYDPTLALSPWLRRIAVNVALDELRRQGRANPVANSGPILERLRSGSGADRAVELDEILDEVEAALDGMPIDLAAVFRLRVQEDLGYREIAESLDIPMGTVMSRLARARGRVAAHLAAQFGDALPRYGKRKS